MINQDALRVWQENLSPDDRLLILGGSGWFGQTAAYLSRGAGGKILAIGSREREILVAGQMTRVNKFDWHEICDFSPTVVIDAWFLTREKIALLGADSYRQQCLSLIEKTAKVLRLPSVRKIVSLSSGAAVSEAKNFEGSGEMADYGLLKKSAEDSVLGIAGATGKDATIVRVFSVTGAFVQRPRDYAFSNLALQSLRGRIEIQSPHPVYRRYVSVEDVLATSLATAKPGGQIFSTGGPLVELQKLAEIFCRISVDKCEVLRENYDSALPADAYFAEPVDWEQACADSGLRELDLESQARNVVSELAKCNFT